MFPEAAAGLPWPAPASPSAGEPYSCAAAEAGSAPAAYELLGEIGRGGMGVVYQARQVHLNRLVALKRILAGADASPEYRACFRTEAEAAARLQHFNIVQIFEVGEYDGLPYFSLEFVDGGSLDQKLARTPLPARAAADPGAADWLQQQKYAEAEPLLREGLAIVEEKLPDSWLRFQTQSLLGGSLAGQKKYAEAEPLLVSGYEGLKSRLPTIPAHAKTRPAEALERLVQFYATWGKLEQAATWRAKQHPSERK